MARKPLFEDIEDGFLGMSRPKNPSRPVAASNPTGVESEIPPTKASSSMETVSSVDEAPSAEEALRKDAAHSKEKKEYVCRAQSCNYRGKALHHWKIHARHSGHLSFGCNLVQGDSFTYIPHEGTTAIANDEPAKPEKEIEHKDTKMPATSKLSESEKEMLEAAVNNMTKDKRHLFTDHPEFLNHWEQHWKGRSRLALVTLALVLAHSLVWYNHYDVGYQPNDPVNIISVLLVGYVIMYFGIAFFDKFPWEKHDSIYNENLLMGLGIQLSGIGVVVYSESMILTGFIALMFIGSYLLTADEVSVYVFEKKTGVSWWHRQALSMRYQAMLVATCSFLLAAAENYLIG